MKKNKWYVWKRSVNETLAHKYPATYGKNGEFPLVK